MFTLDYSRLFVTLLLSFLMAHGDHDAVHIPSHRCLFFFIFISIPLCSRLSPFFLVFVPQAVLSPVTLYLLTSRIHTSTLFFSLFACTLLSSVVQCLYPPLHVCVSVSVYKHISIQSIFIRVGYTYAFKHDHKVTS